MNRLLFTIITFAIVAAASAADDVNVRAELKKFDGTWQLISSTKDGTEIPAEVVKKIRVVIQGGKHSVFFGEETAVKEIPFTVDPTKKPMTTLDQLPDGKQIKGICKLDGDTMTSCVAEVDKDRPSEFASKAGSGHTLRVFKRVKP